VSGHPDVNFNVLEDDIRDLSFTIEHVKAGGNITPRDIKRMERIQDNGIALFERLRITAQRVFAIERTNEDFPSLLEAVEKGRDEARELHAEVSAKYGEVVSRLDQIHRALESWRGSHPLAGVAPEAIDCEFETHDSETVAQNNLDPDALPYYGAFAGAIPSAVSE
jgi:hypothetical protein